MVAMPFTDAMVCFALDGSRYEAVEFQERSSLLKALIWQGNMKQH